MFSTVLAYSSKRQRLPGSFLACYSARTPLAGCWEPGKVHCKTLSTVFIVCPFMLRVGWIQFWPNPNQAQPNQQPAVCFLLLPIFQPSVPMAKSFSCYYMQWISVSENYKSKHSSSARQRGIEMQNSKKLNNERTDGPKIWFAQIRRSKCSPRRCSGAADWSTDRRQLGPTTPHQPVAEPVREKRWIPVMWLARLRCFVWCLVASIFQTLPPRRRARNK